LKDRFIFNPYIYYSKCLSKKLIRDNVIEFLELKVDSQYETQWHYTLEAIIANCNTSKHHGFVLSLNQNNWKKDKHCPNLSYRILLRLIKSMLEKGFLTREEGFNGDSVKQAAHYYTTELFNSILSIAKKEKMSTTPEALIQYNKDVSPLSFDKQTELEISLAFINGSMAQHTYSFDFSGYSMRPMTYQDETVPGRIYAPFQNLPALERKDFLIDGEETVMLDFKSSHLAIAYDIDLASKPKDMYSFPGAQPEARDFIKASIVRMLNCKDKTEAVASISRFLIDSIADKNSDFRKKKTEEEMASFIWSVLSIKYAITGGLNVSFFEVDNLSAIKDKYNLYKRDWIEIFVDQLAAQHPAIKDKFFSSFGIKAMDIEGQVAINVLTECAKQKIPCLNVHDEYICKKSDEVKVRWIMRRATDAAGFSVEVEKKKFNNITATAQEPMTLAAHLATSDKTQEKRKQTKKASAKKPSMPAGFRLF
jgi:hypothetical protein